MGYSWAGPPWALQTADKVSISFSSDLVTFLGAIQKPCSNVLSLAGFMFGSPERVWSWLITCICTYMVEHGLCYVYDVMHTQIQDTWHGYIDSIDHAKPYWQSIYWHVQLPLWCQGTTGALQPLWLYLTSHLGSCLLMMQTEPFENIRNIDWLWSVIDIHLTESICFQESFDAAKSWVAELQNTDGSCFSAEFSCPRSHHRNCWHFWGEHVA